MKMTEPCNLGLLALISAAGEISYEELKQRYLPPEQPGVIQGVTASFDNDIKTLEKEKYIPRIQYTGISFALSESD